MIEDCLVDNRGLSRDKFVLFGAGLTGKGVIEYFGRERVVAIIDNSPQKQGGNFENLPIISLEEYIANYRQFQIVISIYSKWYYSARQQLLDAGIFDFFTAPPLLYGTYDLKEVLNQIKKHNTDKILLYGYNPISFELAAQLEKTGYDNVKWVKRCEWESNSYETVDYRDCNNSLVVITTNPEEDMIRNQIVASNIVDIYEACYEKKTEIAKFNHVHEGESCFIIGNGPSLRIADLELLQEKKIVSFGSNGLFNIFDKTDWRPDYYMVIDGLFYKNNKETIQNQVNVIKFLPILLGDIALDDSKSFYYTVKNYITNDALFEFSDDASQYICSGKTVTYALLQMACYMGFKTIYLLGVDWTGGKGSGIARGHFYKDNLTKTSVSYDLIDQERIAYESAFAYAKNHGVEIYNATRGGELEIFDRISFDELMNTV